MKLEGNYHEFRADTPLGHGDGSEYISEPPELIEEQLSETPPRKPMGPIKKGFLSAAAGIAGFALVGAALNEGNKVREHRRVRMAELQEVLSTRPRPPLLSGIDSNDPERAAKEADRQELLKLWSEFEELKHLNGVE